MFKAQNRIIIVDDQNEGLLTLAKKFSDKGLTYKLIEYSQLDDMNREKLTGVRLAFFDINLVSGQMVDLNQKIFDYENDSSLSTIYNTLSGAIESIISFDNGPFVLIFWSANTCLVENFIKYINDRDIDIPKPLIIECINKEDVNHIDVRISEILDQMPIRLLYNFERKCEMAATNTINQIFGIIPKDGNLSWGNEDEIFRSNFKKVFSKIAISKLGKEHAQKHPDRAIYESLIPLVEYELINFLPDSSWKELLGDLNNGSSNGFDNSKLNSMYHLDLKTEVTLNQRGAVFRYDVMAEGGVNPNYYFKEVEQKSQELFDKFIRFNSNISDFQKRYFRGSSIFALIEISPACDYSQNKSRNLNYLLALFTPIVKESKISFDKIGDSILHKDIPTIYFDKKKYKIWINLNYSFSNLDGVDNVTKPLFVLKKELVDMIGNRYANHISRIGITSF